MPSFQRPVRLLAALIASAGLGLSALAQTPAAQPAKPAEQAASTTAPYMRVAEDGQDRLVLKMAIREFAPPRDDLPRLFVAGAVHIGNPDYYASLQEFLDKQDLVLFEGVKPPGAGDPAHDLEEDQNDARRAKATQRRLRFIAMAAERFRADEKRYPASLDELLAESGHRIAELLAGATVDAWGNALAYELEDGGKKFDIISYGADGRPGGEGVDADIRYRDQKPVKRPEGGRTEGIQQKLASSLGVVFQGDAMDHNRPNWRNSDLAVDQVQARLERTGGNADQLFSMLEGSSIAGRLAGMMLDMVAANPRWQAMLKMMLMETVAVADEMIEGAPGMRGFMQVILEDRNAVVIDDLKQIVAREEGRPATIGIIYGAGHLPTLEQRIVQEIGYTPAGDQWLVALDVDAQSSGLSSAEFRQMRQMMSQMMERQLQQLRKQKR